MDELPTTLSPDEAAAVVALVERPRLHVAGGFGVATAAAAVAWLTIAHWVAAVLVLCVAFPVAARLMRAWRLGTMRRAFARDPAAAARRAQAAWERASPGQRAALQMVLKNRS